MFASAAVDAVRTMPPGYFAVVMATGIISVGLELVGVHVASLVLLAIAATAYIALVILTLWRGLAFPREFAGDMAAPTKGFAFFTFVAGTNVLGTRLQGSMPPTLPLILLAVAFAAWLVLGYTIPWIIVANSKSREALAGVDGTWFIWAVASHSVAVAAAGLEPQLPSMAQILSIVAVLSWGIGVALYAVIGISVVIKILINGIEPRDFGPQYWVTMGACAIAVLAGSHIVEMSSTPMVHATRGLISGTSVVVWAFATWLIPGLIAMGWWRHFLRRVPFSFTVTLWSMVFPLGMYAVASIDLGRADRLPVVGWIGAGFLWIAILAWIIVSVATGWHLVRRLTSPVPAEN